MSWSELAKPRPQGHWSSLIEERPDVLPTSLPTAFSGNGKVSKPVSNMFEFSSRPIEANTSNNRAASWFKTGLEFASNRLGYLSLAFNSIGSTGMESFDYKRYHNAATQKLAARGFVFFMTAEIAGDLNAFGRRYNSQYMTGTEIASMAREFDRLFCPLPTGVFAPMVAIEWPASGKTRFNRKSTASFTQGGMRGGDKNAYWGITQFGNSKRAPTYDETVSAALRFGVILPAERADMTFGQMLVAAYVLMIVRQPTLVQYKIPINWETVYINHNQGNGVWSAPNKKIPSYNWNAQSIEVHRILRKYGYTSA